MNECIFCKIANKLLPADIVFENELFIAFHDLKPLAPVHILLIPKKHVASLQDVTMDDEYWLGKMLLLAPKIATQNDCKDGFRVVSNAGISSGQEVFHLHFHILGKFSNNLTVKRNI
ncbi:Hit-like protein involved in cell-cycle regulation [Candidatus Kinetoplastibacterium desouzaii TCC079E]|uniref:Hit-like protein involved in cell-cycle regulation n=1 Tax=Candidatus Kinetoplastidibacterium desouzai TCC079E TaxID=1208919 RepID=M1LLD9_9PROT|nr:Hit-like protein involved in cell-cycle regulation [Candidatus Kinetoplastibacterium desouzaii TCC079E]